jgi:hypothetical protein
LERNHLTQPPADNQIPNLAIKLQFVREKTRRIAASSDAQQQELQRPLHKGQGHKISVKKMKERKNERKRVLLQLFGCLTKCICKLQREEEENCSFFRCTTTRIVATSSQRSGP